MEDLKESLFRELASLPQEQHSRRADFLGNIGALNICIFDRTRSLDTLNQAVRQVKDAVSLAPETDPNKPIYLSNLSKATNRRYRQTRSRDDLESSIRTAQEAVDLNPPTLEFHLETMTMLGVHIRDRYLMAGSMDDLRKATQILRDVVTNTSKNNGERANRLYNLGLAILDRSSHSGAVEDLNEASSFFEDAANAINPDRPDWATCQAGVGKILLERYVKLSSVEDLTRAIQIYRFVLDHAPEHHPDRAMWLGHLGTGIWYHYRRTGSNDDLQKSMDLQRRARDMTPPSHSAQGERLNALAVAYRERFLRTGSTRDLETALEITKDALDAIGENHPHHAMLLHNLAQCFYDQYLVTRSMESLQNAIHMEERAIRETPDHHPARYERLNGLGACLRERYRRTGSINDVQNAIDVGKEVVRSAEPSHSSYFVWLNNLAGMYYDLAIVSQTDTDTLEEAIRLRRFIVEKISPDHAYRAEFTSALGVSLFRQFEQRGSQHLNDLEEVIHIFRSANQATPRDHPGFAKLSNHLGVALRTRYNATKSPNDLQEALNCFVSSLRQSNSSPLERLKSARRAAKMALLTEQFGEAACYLAESIDLLPKVAIRSNGYEDHLHNMRVISNLGPLAASTFLKARRSTLESFQVLEQARGVISSLLIDSRSDISLLKECHPDLWSTYSNLRELVATSFSEAGTGVVSMSLQVNRPESILLQHNLRRQNNEELDRIVAQIRQKSGFERFHLAPTENGLYALAQDGPIVSYNVTELCSHAFLITSQSIQVLPLPQLSLESLEEHFPKSFNRKSAQRDAMVVSIDGSSQWEGHSADVQAESMQWLWDVALKPVLGESGVLRQRQPSTALPCIWWLGGGMLSLLPLHAAGDHGRNSLNNTMSHVVSSYVSTIKTLQFSRSKAWNPLKANDSNMLVIAMPQTPKHNDFPDFPDLDVEREVANIKYHVGSSASVDVLYRPSCNEVRERVTGYSLVHFACHGSPDAVEPSNSALFLGKEHLERLTVKDLQPLSHQLAQIAYLSACSTAEIGDQDLINESIHLASTFQLVGFRHVIGTLSTTGDDAAVAVAAKFYEQLFQNANAPSAVARALHHAVLDQKANSNSFDWAPFIHIGP